MTERSRPWSGTVTGDAGPYSDDQWTDVWKTLLGPTIASEGVFKNQLNDLAATGAVTPVSINTGRALVDGSWYESDAAVTVAIPTPAANPRIDRIVLRKDWALQTVRITRIAGAEAASPVPPAITQIDGTTWDLPLWQIHVTIGAVVTVYVDEREFLGQYEPAGDVSESQIYMEDDFFEPGTYATGEFRRYWDASVPAGGAIAPLTGLAGFGGGAITCSYPAATDAAGASLSNQNHRPEQINARLNVKAKEPNTDANLDRLIGWASSNITVTPVDGIFFRSVGAGNWFAVCRAGAVETTVDTTQAPSDTFKRFEIRVHSSISVSFFIDGTRVATIIADIPVNIDLQLVVPLIKDSGLAPAAQAYQDIDYMNMRGDR